MHVIRNDKWTCQLCWCRCSPLSVVLLSPEVVVGLIHEHAVLEVHNIGDPPDSKHNWEHEEHLPVLPRDDSDENGDDE